LIDFDWIEGHLISGQVGSGHVRVRSDQFDFLKKSDRVGFGSGQVGRVCRVGSGSATSNYQITTSVLDPLCVFFLSLLQISETSN
jgi:hypothetical protein